MDVGNRIKERRIKLDMSVDDLADVSGLNRATIYRYEKGQTDNMQLKMLPQLAEALKTTPAYLLGWTENPEQVRMIPVIGKIACGVPILAEKNIEEYREEVDVNLPSGELFFLKTQGDSMYPTVPLNSYVLIHAQEDVENGEIAAVLMEETNEVTLKRVKKQNDVIMLYADNNKYEPIIINKHNPARIIGKAVKFSGNL